MRARDLIWASFLAVAVDGYSLTFHEPHDGICDGEVVDTKVQLQPGVCYPDDIGIAPEISIQSGEVESRDVAVKFYQDDVCENPIFKSAPGESCAGPVQHEYGSFKIVNDKNVPGQSERRSKHAKRGNAGQPSQEENCHNSNSMFGVGQKVKLRGTIYQWEEGLDESDLKVFPDLRGTILTGVKVTTSAKRSSRDVNDVNFDLASLRRRNPPPASGSGSHPNPEPDPCDETDVTDAECRFQLSNMCRPNPARDDHYTLRSLRLQEQEQGGPTIDDKIVEIMRKTGKSLYHFIKKNPIFALIVNNIVVIGVAYWSNKNSQPQCENLIPPPQLTREAQDKYNIWKQSVQDMKEDEVGGTLKMRFGNESVMSMEIWWESNQKCRPVEFQAVPSLTPYCKDPETIEFATKGLDG